MDETLRTFEVECFPSGGYPKKSGAQQWADKGKPRGEFTTWVNVSELARFYKTSHYRVLSIVLRRVRYSDRMACKDGDTSILLSSWNEAYLR
jgi:hypothetical protein